ncbi:MAG: Spy/CpxP family protein refolding chaperone [Gemmatimonadales bacterium]
MNRHIGIALAVTLLIPTLAAGQRPEGGEPGFEAHLFPPELVMQHQLRLGLTEEQRTAITAAIKELQGEVVDLEWRLQEENQRLADLLAGASVDRAAALAQVERLLEVERQIKTAHLGLLITIKNTLSAEQQAVLRELRPKRGNERP